MMNAAACVRRSRESPPGEDQDTAYETSNGLGLSGLINGGRQIVLKGGLFSKGLNRAIDYSWIRVHYYELNCTKNGTYFPFLLERRLSYRGIFFILYGKSNYILKSVLTNKVIDYKVNTSSLW